MFSKAIIVFAALVSCQGDYLRNKEAVGQSIDLFREASNKAMIEGSQKLNQLVVKINISSTAVEEKKLKKLDKSIILAIKKIDILEEDASNEGIDISECAKHARADLATLLVHLNKAVKDCGSKARKESNKMVNEILDSSGSEAYYKREGFSSQMSACMKQENELCLNNLLAVVSENVKEFPKELKKRFNITVTSLNDVEKDMDKCVDNVDNDASKLIESIVIKMSECFKSRKEWLKINH
ncbi:PREDICTED: uncharacterized protein LOC108562962 [Nicrophorus vespilloides]|uniref:Uncharacterized protein LOC108562962 n=1 Tax=Nicrophorus vespilloides TaxID=110193 RepID=A0ABM1MQW5_NICVS|nr:PREDICTED: uncharacterized protein LOC108562962 [Nicrophorus vespilloides]